MIVKPVFQFDPSCKEHRQDFNTLIITKCMGKMKNKYTLEGNFGSLQSLMTERIAEFYIQNEFNNAGVV